MNSDDSCTLNPVSPIMSNITSGVPEAEEMAEDDVQCTPCGDEYGMRSAKVLRGPKEPTAEEIAEHNVKHVPYRSWCPHCVAAAGRQPVIKETEMESNQQFHIITSITGLCEMNAEETRFRWWL